MGRLQNILHLLRRRKAAQGAFAQLFSQPQTTNIGGTAAEHATPAAASHPPITPSQAMQSIFDGADRSFQSTAFVELDPQTNRVVDRSVEHTTVGGELIKDEVIRKVLTAEGRYVLPKEIVGKCTECGLPAITLHHCFVPGCGVALCIRHAISVGSNQNAPLFACRRCVEQLERTRNTWAEFDAYPS